MQGFASMHVTATMNYDIYTFLFSAVMLFHVRPTKACCSHPHRFPRQHY